MDSSLDVWTLCSPLLSLWINRFYIYLGFAFGISLWICFQIAIKKQAKNSQDKSVPKATQDLMPNGFISLQKKPIFVSGVKIFYGSQTGTAKGFAAILARAVTSLDLPVEVINLKEYDPDDHLIEEVTSKSVCAFLVATYTDGRPPESAEWFCRWLEEAASDFRFGKTYLKGMRYSVFGLGNSAYPSHFNRVGKSVDKWLWMLGARRVLARGEGDCDVVRSKHGSIEADFAAWKAKFISRLQVLREGEDQSCGGRCKKGKCDSKPRGSQEPEPGSHLPDGSRPRDAKEEEPCESSSEGELGPDDRRSLGSVVDVEDLGKIMNRTKTAKREKDHQEEKTRLLRSTGQSGKGERRAMITPALRDALTKQGYQLIGSHSGVKLCRWTKDCGDHKLDEVHAYKTINKPGVVVSMLRGRGGCYKHTFYGIESHRCMETTPSLACANKCVFCWRHHTNPVGTEWRWKMDQPEMILKEAVENHQNMIKQFKGVPGVKAARFEEGMRVKHCALSLVGEPIMYPQINRFLQLLHHRGISSFLVTNAQFPEEIRNLKPVTQLYVSVDASTKDSLKKIDRPLFKDFWQRFLDSLKALAAKRQRTVYRLTLVKSWNVDELQAYAELVSLGRPDFIEVKGVTYCGESSASSLTMANVPWHEEVVRFVCELVDLIPDYEIACEHEHSNCLLIAHKRIDPNFSGLFLACDRHPQSAARHRLRPPSFKIDGEWWTWIDYNRFQELVQEYEDSGGSKTFCAEDYVSRTPPWALFGASERGFDPKDTRHQRKSRSKNVTGC
ncbi:PREDICTED: S-adenosyl-L-methionine-dependent tRNA 4-demethylwyosine synthase isoform X2 [Chinchilla lanigera]|uniref:S-adenosyl-L-methionine-dependent tRNA 4-demethylwyosine synthase isoform X2 n=1 Tax=Chinchilla lanigera TaxID=34839 RepID=UPI000695EAA9|nr:PREDICTED: S-adenosyl-L-methionine-dependent tRNA 4-demethylwyosine synthase isoform X2 [Chinchilla lanigera]